MEASVTSRRRVLPPGADPGSVTGSSGRHPAAAAAPARPRNNRARDPAPPPPRPASLSTIAETEPSVAGDGAATARLAVAGRQQAAAADIFDLPAIPDMKNAIARLAVSGGVGFVLPVDKTRLSVDGQYRTDLRAMFTEPYNDHAGRAGEEWMNAAARHHHTPNTRSRPLEPPRGSRLTKSSPDYRLNMESEAVRTSYSYSAPNTGLSARRLNGEVKDMRPRSDLFLPLKARVPPEALKLKEEAERILRDTIRDDDDDPPSARKEAGDAPDIHRRGTVHVAGGPGLASRKSFMHVNILPDITLRSPDEHSDEHKEDAFRPHKKAGLWNSYEDLKAFSPPEKRPLPAHLAKAPPPGLSPRRTAEIWDWLNDYERIDDFTYFMEVCR